MNQIKEDELVQLTMNNVREGELVDTFLLDAETWDSFIVDNENVISAQKNHKMVMSMLESMHTLANSKENKVGFSILRNQLTFSAGG